MLKSSIFNQSHFLMIKMKDGVVLNFSFFKKNHFVYACMGREGRKKIRLFTYIIIPNQARVLKKLTKLLKPSYLN